MYCIVDNENTSNEASADIDNYELITPDIYSSGKAVTESTK